MLGVGNDKEGHYTREELGTLCPRIVGNVSSCGHLSALSSDEDCLVLPPSGNLTDSSSSSLAAVIAFSSAVLKTGCVRGPFHPALRATCSTCAYIRTLPPGGDPPPHHLPGWRTPPHKHSHAPSIRATHALPLEWHWPCASHKSAGAFFSPVPRPLPRLRRSHRSWARPPGHTPHLGGAADNVSHFGRA